MDNGLKYSIKNINAIKKEHNSPGFDLRVPRVRVAMNDFALVGIKGKGADWQSFGKWQFDNLVTGKGALPEATINKVKKLVENAESTTEKAKRIYQYVQSKTRYISVQLGIGGWVPMKASDVDKLGYGDCKALSNYTKALMDSQGIPAYYSVVYGDRSKKDIDSSFASMQGNHVILNVPDGEQDLWLECTSQDAPFNFIAGFTDDRDVLVLTPEGGVIKHTTKYPVSENTLNTKAMITIRDDQSINAKVAMKSKGTRYAQRYRVPKKDKRDRELYYKNYWSYLNGVQLTQLNFQNDKEQIVFTEKVDLRLERYASKAGSRLLINPNFFNREYTSLPKYDDRKTPLVIARGYIDTDVYEIKLPEGYQAGALPESKKIETPFGIYECEVTKSAKMILTYKRTLQINEGEFSKDDYEAYRQFRETIKKADHAKIVLSKL